MMLVISGHMHLLSLPTELHLLLLSNLQHNACSKDRRFHTIEPWAVSNAGRCACAHSWCDDSRRDLVGLILVKDLVLVDMQAGTKVSNIRIRNLPFLRADTPMYDLLKVFQTGRSHMLVLTRHPDMDMDLLANPSPSPHANGDHSPSFQVNHTVYMST